MATTYYADFVNDTDRTWTMAVYQTLPTSIGLESVSWQQTTVPQSGESGVSWEVTYDVVIANLVQIGGKGVYKASQTLPATLGSSWQIVFRDGVQQLVPGATPVAGDQILISNDSGFSANPGIGMSGEGAVYQPDTLSGSDAQFLVEPSYYVGLFNDVQLGEVISSNVVVGPLQLQYPDGLNLATLTAKLNGQNIVLTLTYGAAFTTSLERVEKRLHSLQSARKAA